MRLAFVDFRHLSVHPELIRGSLENKCGHFGVALEKGELTENSIICSEHGIEFDLLTGNVMNNHWDDCDAVNVFKIVLRDEIVGVEL